MNQDNIVLKVENLSKQYRLGQVGTGTLSEDLNRWWHKIRGKEDPYAKIGQVNDRSKKAESDFVWALKDINFEVKKGDIVGIIGKNGAGKSTLLKLLSQITSPTTGKIQVKGRIAALLEVGTGMHPDMTARENIYMNGAILGMRKKEIDAKFDDIVDFSGCAMYVDTPIKRFSSGMQVRLGFAVAAFLDPEILIVDEVLAVGDAEFQQKAIGKMQDISSNGERTVLFVSHNMVSIQALCNRAILLGEGGVIAEGKVNDIVDKYMDLNTKDMKKSFSFDNLDECPGNKFVKIKSITIKPEIPSIKEEIKINFEVVNLSENNKLTIAVDFLNNQDMVIFGSATDIEILNNESKKIQCNIPKDFLNDNTYYINVYILDSHKIFLFQLKRAISFDVKDEKRELGYLEKVSGEIRPLLKWNLINE